MSPRAEVISNKVICKEPGRYIGWPTIVRTRAGELIIVFSGDRDDHVCPWGKMEMIRSSDSGQSWTDPLVIVNTPLDDRDAGLVETSEGILIVSWFTSVGFEEEEKYQEHGKTISQEVRDQWLGHWTQRSTDSGATWEDPVRSTVSTPHGPIELDDGRLVYLGHCTLDGKGAVAVDESTDRGRSWNVIGAVPTPEGIGLGEDLRLQPAMPVDSELSLFWRHGTQLIAIKPSVMDGVIFREQPDHVRTLIARDRPRNQQQGKDEQEMTHEDSPGKRPLRQRTSTSLAACGVGFQQWRMLKTPENTAGFYFHAFFSCPFVRFGQWLAFFPVTGTCDLLHSLERANHDLQENSHTIFTQFHAAKQPVFRVSRGSPADGSGFPLRRQPVDD